MENHNPAVWFEIYVNDMARAKRFYESVLAVNLESMKAPMDGMDMCCFPMKDHNAPGATGALVKMHGMPTCPGTTMVYFACKDCSKESSRIAASGGKVVREKFAIGEYGFIVIATDTEGNAFGLHSME